MANWTDADYGREDGRADALAGTEPTIAYSDDADEYNRAYLQAYDAALAEIDPEHVRLASPR